MTILNRYRLKAGHPQSNAWCLTVALLLWFAMPSARADAPRSFERAMIIPVKGEINEITTGSITRRFERVRAEQIPLVIFQLDTPGGAVGPALKICSAIKQLRSEGVKTYAWVRDDAYSAGAIIALAADGIIMSPNGTMGDCQPLMVTEKGPSAVPTELEAKIVSPVLAEMRDSGRRNNYSQVLIDSMVRPDMQIFWIENQETGERRFVDVPQRDEWFGWSGTHRGSAETAPADSGGGRPTGVEPFSDTLSKTAWRYVRQDEALGEVHQPIVSAKELLTMKADRAKAYGFSLGTVGNEAALREFFGVKGEIIHTELSPFESAAQWLASPMVRSVLFILIVLGLYAEFHAPGIGLPGAVAAVALILFLGAPYLAGFTVTWEIVVVIVGMLLIAVELFVLPGFGVAGIAGLILVGIGMLASFVPPEPIRRPWFDPPQLPVTYIYLRQGLMALTGGLIGSAIGIMLLARFMPRAPVLRRIIAPNPTHEAVTMEAPYRDVAQLGDVGRTETYLRPAGKARFGSVLVDVVSEGEYVERGEQVEVIERHGNRIVVRPVRG